MKNASADTGLDRVDKEILRVLQDEARISNVELGRRVHLSPPAVHARVRQLEELGYILGYRAVLDREKLGFDMLCIVHVNLQIHELAMVAQLRETILSMPEVLECYSVTGAYDYIVKLLVRNRHELERFLMQRLMPLPGVARVQTSLVLGEVRGVANVPVD